MGMFSWDCVACGFSLRDCRRCTEDSWQGNGVVLTPGGSRVIGHYDSYGNLGGVDLGDQIDGFAVYHKACYELAGKPEFEKESRRSHDQGFCLGCHDDPYYTLPKPTSPEWFTIAHQWHAIERMLIGIHSFQYRLEERCHKDAYEALSDERKLAFEHHVLGIRPNYNKPEETFRFGDETWNICTSHLLVCCVKRDVRGEEWPRSPQLHEEEWVGDEIDGCYVKVWEMPNGEYGVEVIVDSETGSFVDTLKTLGNYTDPKAAMNDGCCEAIEWCMTNEVNFEKNDESAG